MFVIVFLFFKILGIEKLNAAENDDDEDDWDDETNPVPAYDPSAKADKFCILPAGLTPAERRNFRMEKRLCSNGSSENLSAENGLTDNGSIENWSDENGSDENGSVEIELNEAPLFDYPIVYKFHANSLENLFNFLLIQHSILTKR